MDFNQIINRKNTNSLKYDFGLERKGREDLLPLWIADMDFKLPDEVIEDLVSTVSHGIFGYTDAKDDYFLAVHNWFLERFHWDTKKEWLVKTPGIVFAIAQAINAFTKEGDGILIQQPVYYPFAGCIKDNNRKVVNSQLHYEDGHYSIDFEDFEKKIVAEKVKLFILCSPHNPVGRVWSIEELHKIGTICIKHKVLIISDEIHCDFTYPGYSHTVFASISESFAQNSIICTAPSKTFNIAGLQVSNIFIPNPVIRQQLEHQIDASGYSQLNTVGIAACRSVYTKGAFWLEELKAYLLGNLNYVRTFLADRLPELRLIEPEGTYLIWIDFQSLNLPYKELEKLITQKAGLWLDGGVMFGKESTQFERINIACPRSILEKAMLQLETAIHDI